MCSRYLKTGVFFILLSIVFTSLTACYVNNNRDATFPISVQLEIPDPPEKTKIIIKGETHTYSDFTDFQKQFQSVNGEESLGLNLQYNKRTRVVTGSASGVVLTHDGLILTNHHVTETNPSSLEVFFQTEGQKVMHRAQLVAFTNFRTGNDLAVIKVNATFPNVVRLGEARQIRTTAKLYNWGYPGGLSSRGLGKNFNSGYISRTGIVIPFFSKQPRFLMGIRGMGGVSGSGIYANDGRLIGLMQGHVAYGRWMVGIPVDQIRRFLDEHHIRYSG